jgi:hypothetical protein
LPRRQLRREADGSLYDIDEGRRVGTDELRDDVRGGRNFRVYRGRDRVDCTHEVLGEVLGGGMSAPGPGSGTLSSAGSAVTGILGMLAGRAESITDLRTRDSARDSVRDSERGRRDATT